MRERQPTSHPLRGIVLAGLLALLAVCWCSGSAFAAGGPLVNVGAENSGGKPAIAVDSAGTAYVVWPQSPASGQVAKTLDYCVLPAGASSCAQQGTLTPGPSDSADINGAPSVVVDGSDVVVVADVDFAGEEFNGVQEWLAPDGTATFAQVDGGHAVADPEGLGPDNLIVLPGSNVLAYPFGQIGNHSAEFVSWAGTSSLSNPPTCDPKSCSTPTDTDLNETNSVFVSQALADYASVTAGVNPGVIGVFNSPFTTCAGGGQGVSFIYGSGTQSSGNSYLIAPGQARSAWRPISNIDCTGYNAALGSGPSGFGELEVDGEAKAVQYRPFDQAHEDFDEPPVTVGATESFNEASVSQDGVGGVYATWNEAYRYGASPSIRFAYSPNGGASWEGPVSLTTGTNNPVSVSSAVGSGGQGWAISTETVSEVVQVFAQPFVKGDAYVPPSVPPSSPSLAAAGLTTSQSGAGQTGASISITAGTTGESDQAHVTGANASIAGGTVHYYLYADSTCDPGVGGVFNGGTSTVTDGVAAPSLPVTEALSPGTYYWQAEYSGDALNSAAKTACGSEVLTVLPAASAGSSGTSNGSTVTVTITCQSSTPCTVTVTITATEVTVAVKADAARRKVKHTRTITLATGTFKVNAHSSKKLAVHLTAAGKAFLAKHHGHTEGTIVVADKTTSGVQKIKHSISITTHRSARHR
jgi:hypothetical protein